MSALRRAICTKLGHLFKAMHSSLIELGYKKYIELGKHKIKKFMKRIVIDIWDSFPKSLREFAEDYDLLNQ